MQQASQQLSRQTCTSSSVSLSQHSSKFVDCSLAWAVHAGLLSQTSRLPSALWLHKGTQGNMLVPPVKHIFHTSLLLSFALPLWPLSPLPSLLPLIDIKCACRKPPQIKFKLDFGKALGSGYTAKAVRLWLDPFLRETLADLIVWPNRIVVPILPENVTGPLDDLMLRYAQSPGCACRFTLSD